jgi:hypothetical protein
MQVGLSFVIFFMKIMVTFNSKITSMKFLLFVFIFFTVSCNCTKKENKVIPQFIPDSEIDTIRVEKDTIPACIKALIKKIEAEPVTSPPSKIYSYTFEGKTVYYVPAVCCDNFSDLYNDGCKIIAHPDGGFTGKGDRKAPNFQEEKTNEKLIWADPRK